MKQRHLLVVIAAVCILNGCSDIQKWWKSSPSQTTTKLEPPQPQPVDSDLPLDSKAAAAACGKVLTLNQAAFVKLDLMARLSKLVHDSGFTQEELKGMLSAEAIQEQAFGVYSLAYLTWDKPIEVSRARVDKMVVDAANSLDVSKLSPAERSAMNAFLVKFKQLMLRAFDLGRHDARISPCPS